MLQRVGYERAQTELSLPTGSIAEWKNLEGQYTLIQHLQ